MMLVGEPVAAKSSANSQATLTFGGSVNVGAMFCPITVDKHAPIRHIPKKLKCDLFLIMVVLLLFCMKIHTSRLVRYSCCDSCPFTCLNTKITGSDGASWLKGQFCKPAGNLRISERITTFALFLSSRSTSVGCSKYNWTRFWP